MASGKEIKARIKSVTNTKKITRAMELISTVKMKKAQEAVVGSRPFAIQALRILSQIDADVLAKAAPNGPKAKELVVLVTSNKGLCGGLNVNAFKKVNEYRKNAGPSTDIDFVSIGKKGREFLVRTGGNVILDFSEAHKDSIDLPFTKSISKTLTKLYRTGEYSKVTVIYSYYISAISQLSIAKTLYPANREEATEYLETLAHVPREDFESDVSHTFEPDQETIVNEVLPMITDLMFFECILEAKASEHASRMVAMKNAKDSAGKKVFSLTLTYNKARQAAITKEVSEIVSGVESMKD